jgi:elongation factor Ts
MDLDAARAELSRLVETQANRTQTAGLTKAQNHGLVGVSRISNDLYGVIEMRCVTDFVAKNPLFSELASKIVNSVSEAGPTDVQTHLEKCGLQPSLLEAVGKLKEPITVTRLDLIRRNPEEAIGMYVHQQVAPGLGAIMAVVGISTLSTASPWAATLAGSLAKHVAGCNPSSVEELLGQEYLFKPEIKVIDLLKLTEKTEDHAGPIKVTKMLRYSL